ncbi:MAG: hypothetical protein J6T33_11235 [Bacteroidales bacterium]|nr:hypothetical protein [Bacteroidales bacterium]
MKKRIILATIAVAIIAGVSIFAACTKEENKRNVVHSNSKSADATDNPYDFMGQWHNEALTGLYNQYNTLFVSDENAYAYLKQFIKTKLSCFDTSTMQTMDELNYTTEARMDLTYSAITGDISLSDNLGDAVLKYVTDSLTKIYTNMVTVDNCLLDPDGFSSKIYHLEDTILSLNQHSTPTVADGNDMILNKYDMVLSCLAIARYSYSFWYNVATDEDNFLHDDFVNGYDWNAKEVGPGSLRGRIRDFFRRVGEVIVDIVETVVDVVVVSFSDLVGGFQPPQNTPNTFQMILSYNVLNAINASHKTAQSR